MGKTKKKDVRSKRLNNKKINSKISKKLVGLFLIVLLALVLLAVKISRINATEGEQYSRIVLSQAQQQYDSKTIPFKRGDILDRNGTILATSEKVYNVILDCKVVNTVVTDENNKAQTPYIEPTITALVEILGVDEDEIRDLLLDDETKESQYQILLKNVSITKRKEFEEYQVVFDDNDERIYADDEEHKLHANVKGVWFEENYLRVYPQESLACDLIGFTYSDNTADWGLEGYYSSVLNGTNGRQYGYFNSDADVEQTIIDPINGKNIVSTIDVNVQQIIRSAIEDYQRTIGGESVAVIAADPNTGEILGMDSTGWYDLNNPRDLSSVYSRAQIAKMTEEQKMDALNDMWRNFCVSDAYEPGSTVKPFTIAGALETGSITTEDTYYCDGYQEVSGQKIKCAVYPDYHGELTVADALAYSCNDCLMQIAERMGAENLIKYQELFNFGIRTGIDLPGEASGILHTTDSMGAAELATSSFGQGFTCTMVQELAAFCSVINGGYYYKPHVVRQITDENGRVLDNIEPVAERQVVSKETSQYIREALEGVVTYGSGSVAKVDGYSMGGKTGTAQKLPRSDGKYLVSFIGFAPLDNPQIVLYVVVDEPHAEDMAESVYAQSVFNDAMTELLPYLGLFYDEPLTETKSSDEDDSYYYDEEDYMPDAAEDNALTDPPSEEEPTEEGNDVLEDGITNDMQAITSQ